LSAETPRPPLFSRRRATLAVAAGILLLALTEAVGAVMAPLRAPKDADWQASAAVVKSGFRPGDLIVTAPEWADQVLRLHLGDLIPPRMAARLDHETYSRVWEISQRGARAPEAQGAKLVEERRFGALLLRRYERAALPLLYDFYDRWAAANVSRVEPGRPPIACNRLPQQHQCPGIGYNFVEPRILEMNPTLRRALYAQPVQGATVAVEYPTVPLGRELAVGAGLHNVWLRRNGEGPVSLRVLVGGKEIGKIESTNRSGWTVARFDTTAWRGRPAPVRFEITAPKAFSRHFGFTAEARGAL
jgi:hypothetical protein